MVEPEIMNVKLAGVPLYEWFAATDKNALPTGVLPSVGSCLCLRLIMYFSSQQNRYVCQSASEDEIFRKFSWYLHLFPRASPRRPGQDFDFLALPAPQFAPQRVPLSVLRRVPL